MAVEHGASLKVVEVVLVDRRSEQVGATPQIEEGPGKRHGGQDNGDDGGDGESATTRRERRRQIDYGVAPFHAVAIWSRIDRHILILVEYRGPRWPAGAFPHSERV